MSEKPVHHTHPTQGPLAIGPLADCPACAATPGDTRGLTDFLLARIAEDEENAGRYVDVFPEGDMAPLFRRVLAECEAKRRIVELCLLDDVRFRPFLQHLAAAHADHPDYRAEWRQ